MAKYRVVHDQNNSGDLIIDDIEDGVGLPNNDMNRLKKQEVYVPQNRVYTTTGSNGEVQVNVDRNRAGFIDLAQTDEVRKSIDSGTIAGLRDDSQVSVINIQPGDLDAPSISGADFDTSSGTETYEVDITVNDGTSVAEDFEITLNNDNINSTTITESDSDAGSDDSDTIATGLANGINNNSTLNSEVTASASGSTVNISTDKEDTPFTYSTNVTDTDGSMSSSEVATGRVVIAGSNFNSTRPFTAEVTIDDTSSGESVSFTQSEVQGAGGIYTDSTIVVLNSQHGLGTATGDVEDVSVFANNQTDSSSTTDV